MAILPSIYSCKTDSQFPGQIFLAQVELLAYFFYQGGVIVCFCNHRPFLVSCTNSSIADVISSEKNRQEKPNFSLMPRPLPKRDCVIIRHASAGWHRGGSGHRKISCAFRKLILFQNLWIPAFAGMTALFPHYYIGSEGRGCEWDLLKNIWMVREGGKFSKFSW